MKYLFVTTPGVTDGIAVANTTQSKHNSKLTGRRLLLLNVLQPCSLLFHHTCTRIDGLLPAATLRAGPPSQVGGAYSVIAGLACVLGIVPLCSYVRVQRLQGVASACSLSSTEWTACLVAGCTIVRLSRPAVLLSCWALGAEPEDGLAALQRRVGRELPQERVLFVVPLCQASSCLWVLGLCKGWIFLLLVAVSMASTFRAE